MKDGFGSEQNVNVIFITFYCKWCKQYKSQPTSLEDYTIGVHCWNCNNYGVILSNEYGQRESFRDGIDGKYFGGYDRKKLTESYGGEMFRMLAEGGVKRKSTND